MSTINVSRMLGQGDPVPSGPASLGGRYRRSEAFRRRAAGGQEPFTARLLAAEDVGQMARRRSINMSGLVLEKPSSVAIETFPLPTSIAGLVDVQTTGTMWNYYAGQTTMIAGGGGVPDGAEPIDDAFSLTFERELDEGIPWVVEAEVPTEILDDGPAAEAALDQLMELVWWRQLEADLISGDGSSDAHTEHLVGLTNTEGISQYEWPGEGTYRLETIASVAAAIGDNEWFDQPLAVVATPGTLNRVFTERDVSGRPLGAVADKVIPQVTGWVASNSLSDGTAIVGAWKRGLVLWIRDSLGIAVTNQYLDYFSRGLSRVQVRTRLTNRVRHTSAFGIVTGL